MDSRPQSTATTCLRRSATWIWYPGDFELWLSTLVQTRRTERDVFIPPFWRVESHHPVVSFLRQVDLVAAERVHLEVEGRFNVSLDGNFVRVQDGHFEIPAGRHLVTVIVFNQEAVPALWLEAPSFVSDESWRVSLSRKPFAQERIFAGSSNFHHPTFRPSGFRLPCRERRPREVSLIGNRMLADFGQESFGYPVLHGLSGEGALQVVYGESREEALDSLEAETWDRVTVSVGEATDRTLPVARAFRYVACTVTAGLRLGAISMLSEERDHPVEGGFRSSSERLNRIWDVARHTLELNTREFFLDGIKRDRWIWSGDAVQSFLMDYYLSGDGETVKRTFWALCGKAPLEHHINTIVDYSLYWLSALETHYLYSGDRAFIERIYERAVTLMEFCLSRRNVAGFLEELPGDWLFLDWAEMPKNGELSAIQMLLFRALEAMARIAGVAGHPSDATRYQHEAVQLRGRIRSVFWDPVRSVFMHHRVDGCVQSLVTGYANMFSLMFGLVDGAEREQVRQGGLLDPCIPRITTPYMSFYRLEALCSVGDLAPVTEELLSYWGGMLDRGATSFWELYDPRESGAAQYAMYGRPYGKSLCHAWGASPVYLLGRFYLGVSPLEPGFSSYLIHPRLGGLDWIEGSVPSPRGTIRVRLEKDRLLVTCHSGAVLRLDSQRRPVISGPQGCRIESFPDHQDLHVTASGSYQIEF